MSFFRYRNAMGATHSQAEMRHSRRTTADPALPTAEVASGENHGLSSHGLSSHGLSNGPEPRPAEIHVSPLQNIQSADQEFPIRRQMYLPFHRENSSNLPPPESWYNDHQNSNSENNGGTNNTDSDTSLHIALTIVNELAELSAWLQRQSSALEASNHITFDPEGRPVFDLSIPIASGPAEPVVPPSYSRATAGNTYLPSLNSNPNHAPIRAADFQRFLSRYHANSYGTPPPSYSRATSQQYTNPSQPTVVAAEQSPAVGRTPPPSYRRAVRDHRERPQIQTAMVTQVSDTQSGRNSSNYVSNVTVG